MNHQWDKIWINGLIATCVDGYGLLEMAAIAVKDDRITWVGRMAELTDAPEVLAQDVYDVKGRCITPGLIDCHTHLVFAGNRAREFELRLQGMSYEAIAREGGGIQSTVKATRAATEEELYQQSARRACALLASGVTTVEIKSGYGLDLETEEKMLRVAKRLEKSLPVTICTTFLGAHCVPAEYLGKSQDYIEYVCGEMLPAIAEKKLATAVDVFCEKIAFDLAQTERVFQTATSLGLRVKCHSEQLSDSGSAELAANYDALSVDHLEHVSTAGIKAIAKSGTVAVLLPGAYYFLREKKMPPVNLLRHHQVAMAISTDCNPGTSPIMSLTLVMNMACTLFGMTPEETLLGVTANAAKALGIYDDYGTLATGKKADLVVWDVQHPAELSYYLGVTLAHQIVKHGEVY